MNKLLPFISLVLLTACKSKSKTSQQAFIPVSSYLKGQVAAMDSSLSRITSIKTSGNHADTTIIPRQEFRNTAKDFLDIPDITSEDLRDDYEESRMFDEQLNNVIVTYTAKKTDAPIRREDIMMQPDANNNSLIKTVIINKLIPQNDGAIEKNLVWTAGQKFLVVTKTQNSGQPEKIEKLEVTWGGFPNH